MPYLAVAGQTYTFTIYLKSQVAPATLQVNPTITAGDFQRSINTAGAWTNLDNLPAVAPAGGLGVEIVLSAAETTSAGAGGRIKVVWQDTADDEWYSDGTEVRVVASDIALTGADGDTLETLSDEIAVVDANVDAILLDTGTDGVVVASHTTAAKAEIEAEALDALESVDLDHLIEVTAGSEEPTDGSYLDQIMNKDSNQTFNASTDSLEALRDTLSSSTITVVSAVDGGTVTMVPYTTWEFTIDGLADLSDAAANGVLFTVKRSLKDADSAAVLQVQEGVGLLVLNGAAGTAAKATLTVGGTEDEITVHVNASQTAFHEEHGLVWDIKKIITTAEDADRVAHGVFVIGEESATRKLTTS